MNTSAGQRRKYIQEYSLDELRACVSEAGFRPYTADQIFTWLYRKNREDFSQMTDLSRDAREFFAKEFSLSPLRLCLRQTSSDGTEKYLFELSDGKRIETVMIPEKSRRTLCVSTQVGCRFKCGFCVSGLKGFSRNLRSSEIVGQFTAANALLSPEKVTHIVFMGIGEPLDNFDCLVRAIRILMDKKGAALGKGRFCVSTMGVIPSILALSRLGLGIRLSLSLHAADRATREKLMPGSKKYPLPELLNAVNDFSRSTSYPVTFEYIMIGGVNSSPEDALALARLVRRTPGKLNLIPYNQSSYFRWQPPSDEEIRLFTGVLRKQNARFTLRRPRGGDISASCGQLRMDAGK